MTSITEAIIYDVSWVSVIGDITHNRLMQDFCVVGVRVINRIVLAFGEGI